MTAPIFLDQITPAGRQVSLVKVPDGRGWWPGTDHMVSSFSSKSELALNLSTSGRYITFMGYVTRPGQLDVSNSNTPGVIDPTNPVRSAYYRAVAQLDRRGRLQFTETNAYSGNNGRAAILNDTRGANVIYAAGNAGNGGTPEPSGIITGAGAQILSRSARPSARSTPARRPRPAASTRPSWAIRPTRSARTPTSAA